MSVISRRLLQLALIWTFLLMSLGAYVRLQDAGLGCPDWPGCYGHFSVPDEPHEISHAERHFGMSVDVGKGWKEMTHRYAASGLGVLMIGLSFSLWRDRRHAGLSPWLALLPLLVIMLQGAFGMWTVTLKLMPVVVTGHLVGGMTLLMTLLVLFARNAERWYLGRYLNWLWRLSVLAVAGQIILGGWVSSNYAGLACDGFPQCLDSWQLPAGLGAALRPDRALGLAADGSALNLAHLAAIHYLHRLGALLVLVLVLSLVWQLWRLLPRYAATLGFVLLLQIALGIANVWLGLPLFLALAHHSGAAALLGVLVYGWVRAVPIATAELNKPAAKSLAVAHQANVSLLDSQP